MLVPLLWLSRPLIMPAFHMWVLALLLLIPVSAKGTEKNSEKQPKSYLGSYHPCDRPSPSSRLLALGQWINMESQYLSLHLSNRRKQASRHMQAAVTCWALCYLHGAVISTFPQLAFWWDSVSEIPCSFKKKKEGEKGNLSPSREQEEWQGVSWWH